MSLSGGLAGLAIGVWAIRLITWLLSDGRNDFVLGATLDWTVLGFTAGLALITGIAFGLAPAIQATSGNLAPALKEARIGGWRGRSRLGLSQVLVVSQISISLLLVIAAGLFVRTLANLHSVELGFNRENVLIFSLNARQAGFKDDALARFYGDLGNRFRHIPGVRNAGFSNFPVAAGYWDDEEITVPGVLAEPGKKLSTSVVSVDQSFLATMQIPVLLGRELQERDIAAPRTVVISQLFAKKFFPAGNPVGSHIGLGKDKADVEIVGVAKTSIYNSLREETPPVLYVPYTQDPQSLRGVWFELRTAGDPLAVGGTVREIVHQAAPSVPIANVKTQAAQIDQTIAQQRTFADLCACFAVLALVIACVGLYGTMAYAVARRTSEIGIRVALGAERGRIVWMMLRQVLALAVVGLAIGLVTAWETAHFVASFLFGVKAEDPVAIWGSAAVLLSATLIAGYGPARRAARVDPMVALRNE
jgi:macrolide transport system ATP-binding/permease protein